MVEQFEDLSGNPVQALEPISTEVVDGGTASAYNTAVTTDTIMRVVSASDLNISVGTSPTATTSTAYLPAGTVEYFKVSLGNKIAVLGGTAYVTKME